MFREQRHHLAVVAVGAAVGAVVYCFVVSSTEVNGNEQEEAGKHAGRIGQSRAGQGSGNSNS